MSTGTITIDVDIQKKIKAHIIAGSNIAAKYDAISDLERSIPNFSSTADTKLFFKVASEDTEAIVNSGKTVFRGSFFMIAIILAKSTNTNSKFTVAI